MSEARLLAGHLVSQPKIATKTILDPLELLCKWRARSFVKCTRCFTFSCSCSELTTTFPQVASISPAY
jgi:hypothetical protein